MAAVTATLKRITGIGRPRKLKSADGFQKALYILLTLLSIFMLIPIFAIFCRALMPYSELFVYPPEVYVRHPTLNNFLELFSVTSASVIPASRYLFNSIIVAVLAVVGNVIVSSLCAYPISKHQFPGHKILMSTILLSMMFVTETVAIPQFLVISHIHIINTYWAHILPHIAAPVSVFLMKQFVDQVPNELLEASRMDGASEWTQFMKVVMPICMPAVATISILAFQSTWSNQTTSQLYMQDEAMKTFPFFMSTILSSNGVAREGAKAASSMILFLPNLFIFIFFQRKVIATMAHSGIK